MRMHAMYLPHPQVEQADETRSALSLRTATNGPYPPATSCGSRWLSSNNGTASCEPVPASSSSGGGVAGPGLIMPLLLVELERLLLVDAVGWDTRVELGAAVEAGVY